MAGNGNARLLLCFYLLYLSFSLYLNVTVPVCMIFTVLLLCFDLFCSLRILMLPTSRLPPGAADTAARGQENRPPGGPGCLLCGRRGCHSVFHDEGPDRLPPLPPRSACWVCGRLGCHSRRHDRDEPLRYPPAPVADPAPPITQSQSNGSRGSNQGERAPQSTQTPRPSAQP